MARFGRKAAEKNYHAVALKEGEGGGHAIKKNFLFGRPLSLKGGGVIKALMVRFCCFRYKITKMVLYTDPDPDQKSF